MKINITKKEYRVLLEMIAIADWVIHATKIKEDSRTEKHRELVQKIYSHAKEMGCEHLIVFDETLGRHFPTREFEENGPVPLFIDEFENDIFWEELAACLADRDLIRNVGKEKLSTMSGEEMMIATMRFEEKYNIEFETNGLDNLRIEA